MLALADGTSMDELTFVDVVGLLDTPQTSCLSSVAMRRYGLLLHESYVVWSACAAVLALAYGTSMDELTFVDVVGLLDTPRTCYLSSCYVQIQPIATRVLHSVVCLFCSPGAGVRH